MANKHLCIENLKVMIYITGFSVLLILFIQSLHRKVPTVTIEKFYVPTLNKTDTANTTAAARNTTVIYFDLKLDNMNPVGIYYRPMNLTFSYLFPTNNRSIPIPLGVYSISGFHQEHHKVKHIRDMVITRPGMMVQPRGGGDERVVVMRVDLAGRIKFKSIVQWKRTVAVGVDVEVDGYTGEKVIKNPIKLVRSGAAPVVVWNCSPATILLLIFSTLFNLMFL